MDLSPPSYDESKVDSGFDASVQNARSLTILDNSSFTFENFEERAGFCGRIPTNQKVFFVIMGILNPVFLIIWLSCMVSMAKTADKVKLFLQEHNMTKSIQKIPTIVKKDDGFWAITNDRTGDKVFFLYQLNKPNRQTMTITQQVKRGTRINKMDVSYKSSTLLNSQFF